MVPTNTIFYVVSSSVLFWSYAHCTHLSSFIGYQVSRAGTRMTHVLVDPRRGQGLSNQVLEIEINRKRYLGNGSSPRCFRIWRMCSPIVIGNHWDRSHEVHDSMVSYCFTETKRIQSINQWEDIHGIPWISQILHTYQSFLLFTHACCRSTAASVVEKWLCHAVSAIKPPGKLQRVCPDIKENSLPPQLKTPGDSVSMLCRYPSRSFARLEFGGYGGIPNNGFWQS